MATGITLGPVKLYIDDVIEPHTAAMLRAVRKRSRDSGQHVLAARRRSPS